MAPAPMPAAHALKPTLGAPMSSCSKADALAQSFVPYSNITGNARPGDLLAIIFNYTLAAPVNDGTVFYNATCVAQRASMRLGRSRAPRTLATNVSRPHRAPRLQYQRLPSVEHQHTACVCECGGRLPPCGDGANLGISTSTPFTARPPCCSVRAGGVPAGCRLPQQRGCR